MDAHGNPDVVICEYTFDECPEHFYCVLPDGHAGEHGGYDDGPCLKCPKDEPQHEDDR